MPCLATRRLSTSRLQRRRIASELPPMSRDGGTEAEFKERLGGRNGVGKAQFEMRSHGLQPSGSWLPPIVMSKRPYRTWEAHKEGPNSFAFGVNAQMPWESDSTVVKTNY